MYNPQMNLERTPLLFEARGKRHPSRHKLRYLIGKRKKRKKGYSVEREMDAPQRSPLTGVAVGHGMNSMPGGGIIKHS